MKNSLFVKIFVIVFAVFLFMMICQGLFISNFFEKYYYNKFIEDVEDNLSLGVNNYYFQGFNYSDSQIFLYIQNTGNPVIVFDEDYKIADENFFNKISSTVVKTNDGEFITLITNYLDKQKYSEGSVLNIFKPGKLINVNAVRLGKSNYYIPLILSVNDESYTDTDAVKKYKKSNQNIEAIDTYGWIINSRYVSSANNAINYRTELLYDKIKDCLIYNMNINEFLKENCKIIFVDNYDYKYLLFSNIREIQGKKYYFVTLKNLVDFSYVKSYIDKYFIINYGILCIILIFCAFIFSKYLSNPLIEISNIAEKIASLDFSVKAHVKSKDQIGKLADNINKMADKLKLTMSELNIYNDELKKAVVITKKNEIRMRILLANMSHEFKTPLGIISGYTQIIENGLYKDDKDKYYRIIYKEIKKMTNMINEVIELSKLTSGYWPLKLVETSLQEIINKSIDSFIPEMEREGFKLDIIIKNDFTVIVDEVRILQVFSNLISNALKYSDEHKLIIISIDNYDEEKILIRILNHGKLEKKDINHIWERYYRAMPETDTIIPSEGIGLEIVRNILEQHESIYGVNEKDGMVCFYFTLKSEN